MTQTNVSLMGYIIAFRGKASTSKADFFLVSLIMPSEISPAPSQEVPFAVILTLIILTLLGICVTP